MKILITGSNGLLGSKLVRLLQHKNVDFLATSKGKNRNQLIEKDRYRSMDITLKSDVQKIFEQFKPDAVIHTAAMTQVDACEDQKELCDEINVKGTDILFEQSRKNGAHFNLLSTDFVFDGENGPYKETDPVNPLSYYAKSKRKAEEILIESDYENWAITRTIIVFGFEPHLSRSNLILWAREALLNKESLKIVDDQYRAPTDAVDLAWACWKFSVNKSKGIFHISGGETKSIFEWVKEIAKFHQVPLTSVQPVSSQTLNQKAKRPPATGFDISKAKNEINYLPTAFFKSLERIEKEIRFCK